VRKGGLKKVLFTRLSFGRREVIGLISKNRAQRIILGTNRSCHSQEKSHYGRKKKYPPGAKGFFDNSC